MSQLIFQTHGALQRGLTIQPGHERLFRDGEDYGVANDYWVFAIRDEQCAAVLRIFSRALNGRLFDTPDEIRARDDDYERRYHYRASAPRGISLGSLDFCTSFPTEIESIRNPRKPTECGYQVGGVHYSGDSTSLGAAPLLLGLDETFMSGPPDWWLASHDVVLGHLIERADVWGPLEGWFTEQRAAALAAHAALPARCTHCDGTGVIPPRRD